MTYRLAVACAVFSWLIFAQSTAAQPGDRYLNMKARVLNILFPLDVTPKPYISKMILRFGDTNTQLVVVVYPGGKSELIRYALAGTTDAELSRLISKMISENSDVTDREIAANLKVDVKHSPVQYEALNLALAELKVVQISPILANRVAVDEFSEYEYWYDTWQESVHFTLTNPSGDAPQDHLVQWMIRFRAKMSDLVK